MSISEREEECLLALRISVAAVLVLQSYVRAVLVRRHEEGWVPPYLRESWVLPTPAEFDERLAALGARFRPMTVSSLPAPPPSPHPTNPRPALTPTKRTNRHPHPCRPQPLQVRGFPP